MGVTYVYLRCIVGTLRSVRSAAAILHTDGTRAIQCFFGGAAQWRRYSHRYSFVFCRDSGDTVSHPQRFERKGASYLLIRNDTAQAVQSTAYNLSPTVWEKLFDASQEQRSSLYSVCLYKPAIPSRRILSAFGAA